MKCFDKNSINKSNNKKRILIVIVSLGRGGAEAMPVNTLMSLNESYSVILVKFANHQFYTYIFPCGKNT